MTAAEFVAALTKWRVPLKLFPGYATRGRPGSWSDVKGVVIHHTGSDSQSDSYDSWLFTEGRASEGIPAPLAHATADFDGDLHLGAVGRANHAGKGSSATLAHVMSEDHDGYDRELSPGADDTDGNARYYGLEVKYDGGQPMTAAQYRTAVLFAAAICDHYGWSALSVIGHREHTRRKNDPGKCSMSQFRRDVRAALLAGPSGTGTRPADVPAPAPVPSKVITIHRSYVNYGARGGYFRSGQITALAEVRVFARWCNRLGVASDRDLRVWETFIRRADWRSAGLQLSGIIRALQRRYKVPVTGVFDAATGAVMAHDGYNVIP
jgi:hypothetical protein